MMFMISLFVAAFAIVWVVVPRENSGEQPGTSVYGGMDYGIRVARRFLILIGFAVVITLIVLTGSAILYEHSHV